MQTSNQVLAYDCTASSSDSVILILKTLAFLLKVLVKLAANKCHVYSTAQPVGVEERLLNNELPIVPEKNKLVFLSQYPRYIYQALLVINVTMFSTLTFTSWIPTFNKFSISNTNCPDFIATCWGSLLPSNPVDKNCNSEMYQWQKFSWAAQFLVMVVVTFSIYQVFKIAHDSMRLCFDAESVKNKCKSPLKLWHQVESRIALPATVLLFSESLALSHLLVVSSCKFPGGINKLVENYFTTAFKKIDSNGFIDKDFTRFTINLTKLDQEIFYGLVLAQIFALLLSIMLFILIKCKMTHAAIQNMTSNVGKYLRNSIELIATAAPIITSLLFFSAAIIGNFTETCFLDNFFHSLFNISPKESQKILAGDKKACNLYSLSAYQGSAILQTVLLLELLFAMPTAVFSIATVLDLLCKKHAQPSRCKLSFLEHKDNTHDEAITLAENHAMSAL
jgi:hypothetical protein